MNDQTVITLTHRVRRSDQVLFQDLGGEAVLLDLGSESYFGLNQVGTRIWQLLDTVPPLADVHSALCDEFDADPERIETDLLDLVRTMHEHGLVSVE